MPRGKQAKAMRVHNRACAAGRSTRGHSCTAKSQKGGKKYSKGETSKANDCAQKLQRTVIYGGVEYQIILRLDNDKLVCTGIYDRMKIVRNLQFGRNFSTHNAKVEDESLIKNIMGMYMLSKENPAMYEAMRGHEVNMIM